MPTPAERRALFFLSALLALGGAARVFASRTGNNPPPSLEERAALDTQIRAVDSARRKKPPGKRSAAKRNRRQSNSALSPEPNIPPGYGASQSPIDNPALPVLPRAPRRSKRKRPDSSATSYPPTPHIDLDVAPASDIERLPRIGPALARRISADRDALGPFGALAVLTRVRGVGPALARILKPYVTFSLKPRPHRVADPGGRGTTRKPRRSRPRVSDPP